MKPLNISGFLRGFAWARLGLAALLLALGPLMASGLMPGETGILALALSVAVASSLALIIFGPPAEPGRMAWLFCLLDAALITAVVAATGGAHSVFAFLYVLSVVGACVLLARTGGLAIAGVSSVLYAGLVLGRTVFPLNVFFDAPQETTALELLTMFLNAGTFLVVAIVAGGLAEQFRSTRRALESQHRDLRDLQVFKDLVFESVGTGLVAVDQDQRITAFNPVAEEITGRPAREAIGSPWRAVFGDAASLDAVEPTIEATPRASVRHETTVARPDGTSVPVRITFSALRSGEGERLGLIAACEDLSTIRAMESRMRQADRLATLGRMAANIAHEIRNPLASLSGAVEVLASGGTAGDARDRLSQIVLRESERLNQIIKSFLDYARPAPLALESADVTEVAEEVLVLLEQRPRPENVKIVREFAPPLRWRVDAQRFRQVLWNFCLNAIEAMPAGGELRVGAAVRGRTLEVWIADTGEGIGGDELGHVFEPFYSTKPEGTGLGLALAHRIVQEHGGDIDVKSSPGQGTTFTVFLPARDA